MSPDRSHHALLPFLWRRPSGSEADAYAFGRDGVDGRPDSLLRRVRRAGPAGRAVLRAMRLPTGATSGRDDARLRLPASTATPGDGRAPSWGLADRCRG